MLEHRIGNPRFLVLRVGLDTWLGHRWRWHRWVHFKLSCVSVLAQVHKHDTSHLRSKQVAFGILLHRLGRLLKNWNSVSPYVVHRVVGIWGDDVSDRLHLGGCPGKLSCYLERNSTYVYVFAWTLISSCFNNRLMHRKWGSSQGQGILLGHSPRFPHYHFVSGHFLYLLQLKHHLYFHDWGEHHERSLVSNSSSGFWRVPRLVVRLFARRDQSSWHLKQSNPAKYYYLLGHQSAPLLPICVQTWIRLSRSLDGNVNRLILYEFKPLNFNSFNRLGRKCGKKQTKTRGGWST